MDYVTGVGKFKGRLIIMLDLSRILRRAELQRLSEVSEMATSHLDLEAPLPR
jgi:chemotaxis signal transduction protein